MFRDSYGQMPYLQLTDMQIHLTHGQYVGVFFYEYVVNNFSQCWA